MQSSIITPDKLSKRLLFELDNGMLTIYTLSINSNYRFRKIVPIIEKNPEDERPSMFYAQAIRGGWDKLPFEDLLNKKDKTARTTTSIISLRHMRRKKVNGICSSFKLYRRWDENGFNLTNIAKYKVGLNEFKKLEKQGLAKILNGENNYQPIRIIKSKKQSTNGQSTILLPTQEYISIDSKNKSEDIRIMPAIMKIPTSVYLSHLIDIGDYERFFEDKYVTDSERLEAFKNYFVSKTTIPMSAFNEREQAEVKEKSKRDKKLLELLRKAS